jgi:hypothetical protein
MSERQIDYRKLSKFQTDAEFTAMMKKIIADQKTALDKRKGSVKGNKKITSVIKASLDKTVLPKKQVSNIVKKVNTTLNVGKPIKENFNKAKKVVKKEIKTLMAMPKMKPKKALSIIKKDTNLATVSKTPTSFGAAFKKARSAGLKTFTFKGKKYTTKLRSDTKKSPSTKLASLPKAKPLSIKADSGEGLLGTNPRYKRTKDIQFTPSKFGGRVSLSARLKEIEAEKKAKGSLPKTLARLAKRKKR